MAWGAGFAMSARHGEKSGASPSCSTLSRAGISEHVRGAGFPPWKSASGLCASTACPAPALSPQQTQAEGPIGPIVLLPSTSMGPFRVFATGPSGGHFLLSLQGAVGLQHSPAWVGGGLAVVKAANNQGNITESWIVDRGHGMPHRS